MIDLEKVLKKDKKKLYRLLQFSLYDGSFFIENVINEDCLFDYTWFDKYFTDKNRESYFIKYENKIAGFVMVNKHLKVLNEGYSVAEFLILPYYRRKHFGREAAFKVFQLHDKWEIQPMDNNHIAYNFWKNVIKEYTNNNYEVKSFTDMEDVFIFEREM